MALKKSMIKKLEKHSLNDIYYIVIPLISNYYECIKKSDAIFVNNKNYKSTYDAFFIATKEQAKKLKDITGETENLIFAIDGDKQYYTIEEIIKDYFNDYLNTETNLIEVTDLF